MSGQKTHRASNDKLILDFKKKDDVWRSGRGRWDAFLPAATREEIIVGGVNLLPEDGPQHLFPLWSLRKKNKIPSSIEEVAAAMEDIIVNLLPQHLFPRNSSLRATENAKIC